MTPELANALTMLVYIVVALLLVGIVGALLALPSLLRARREAMETYKKNRAEYEKMKAEVDEHIEGTRRRLLDKGPRRTSGRIG